MAETPLDVMCVNGFSIRVAVVGGETWFCSADLAEAFASKQSGSDFTRGVPDYMKGTHEMRTPSGNQALACVSWAGVTFLAGRTRTAAARHAYEVLLAGHVAAERKLRETLTALTTTHDATSLAPLLVRVEQLLTRVEQRYLPKPPKVKPPKPDMAALLSADVLDAITKHGPISCLRLESLRIGPRDATRHAIRELIADGRIVRVGPVNRGGYVVRTQIEVPQ